MGTIKQKPIVVAQQIMGEGAQHKATESLGSTGKKTEKKRIEKKTTKQPENN